MAKRHDESNDLKSLAKVARIDYHSKTISLPATAIVGISMKGKIDYLTKYCGWTLLRTNGSNNSSPNDDDHKIKGRKEKHQLSNKKK